ncbi:unnamed protein product [Phytophthora lilii]|uniref:Unnamed protein product n=1 Tax=Phytophthora lilii TaxID=2077276 RepID=A0A9W6TEV1_9STRA|nr:unnamed protein product [Phytophthora lilii]
MYCTESMYVAANVLLDIAVAKRLDHHLHDQEAPVNVQHKQQAQEAEPDDPDPVPHVRLNAVEAAGLRDRHNNVPVRKRVGAVQNVVRVEEPAHQEPHEREEAEEDVGHRLPLQVYKHLGCNSNNVVTQRQSSTVQTLAGTKQKNRRFQRTCLQQKVVDVVDHEHAEADLGEVDVVREEHERDGGDVVHEHLGVVFALDRVVLVGDVEHEVDALEPEAQVDHVVPALGLVGHVGELLESDSRILSSLSLVSQFLRSMKRTAGRMNTVSTTKWYAYRPAMAMPKRLASPMGSHSVRKHGILLLEEV